MSRIRFHLRKNGIHWKNDGYDIEKFRSCNSMNSNNTIHDFSQSMGVSRTVNTTLASGYKYICSVNTSANGLSHVAVYPSATTSWIAFFNNNGTNFDFSLSS